MSKTNKHQKPETKGDKSPRKKSKQFTHRLDRRVGKQQIAEEIEGMNASI